MKYIVTWLSYLYPRDRCATVPLNQSLDGLSYRLYGTQMKSLFVFYSKYHNSDIFRVQSLLT